MIERLIERTLYASRWLLVPMYLCLAVVLVALDKLSFASKAKD